MADELHFEELRALITEMKPEIANTLALQGEGIAKADFPYVDTGFARNSVQAVPAGSGPTEVADGWGLKNKAGQTVDRLGSDIPAAPDVDTAGIAIGAEYGIWLELKGNILANAAQQLKRQAQEIVSGISANNEL